MVEQEPKKDHGRHAFFCSIRFLFAMVAFLLVVTVYAQRVGMSVAIVCMVNQTAVRQLQAASSAPLNATSLDDVTVNPNVTVAPQSGLVKSCSEVVSGGNMTEGSFVWTKDIQGHILGAFFYGYTVSQIPGGLMAERYGGKWVMFIFTGVSALSTVFTPLAARQSFVLLIILRLLVGIGSGVLFPAMHAMLSQWCPPLERAKMSGLIYAGVMVGNIIGMPLSGVLCQHGFDEGWGSIFYVIGGASLASLLLWAVFTSNKPVGNKFMSRKEKYYISEALKDEISDHKTSLREMPWLKFFTSGPVWAIITANFTMDWAFYTLLTNIPTFYQEVLKFDITSNGLYSALPFIALWVCLNVASFISDHMTWTFKISIGVSRKILTSLGMFLPAIFLVALGFLDCTQTGLAVTLLSLSVGCLGFNFSGYFINHIDIAPKYAGTLMGITNGIAAISGFIAPAVAAALTTKQDRESWQKVFFVSGAMFLLGGIVYDLLGSGVVQPWAKDKQEDIKDVKLDAFQRLKSDEKV